MKKQFRNRSFAKLIPELIESSAFLDLAKRRLGYAMWILVRFQQKAHRKSPKKNQRRGQDVITNNGQIVFTYTEAREYGIQEGTFYRNLLVLIEDYGFIDIATGGSTTLPSITITKQRTMIHG